MGVSCTCTPLVNEEVGHGLSLVKRARMDVHLHRILSRLPHTQETKMTARIPLDADREEKPKDDLNGGEQDKQNRSRSETHMMPWTCYMLQQKKC